MSEQEAPIKLIICVPGLPKIDADATGVALGNSGEVFIPSDKIGLFVSLLNKTHTMLYEAQEVFKRHDQVSSH